MDPNTGKLYGSLEEAKAVGADLDRLVLLDGRQDDIRAISKAVKAQHRRRNKAARTSRKRNR